MIDSHGHSSHEPLPEVEAASEKEVGGKENQNCNGGSTGSVAVEWLGSGMDNIQDD